jgi:CRISPR-associated exonuclease Cas4
MAAMFWLAVLLAVLAVFALLLSFRLRARSGLPAGRVIYADTGSLQRNERALVSRKHGLSGKPDYLIEQDGSIIPVELKSGRAPTFGQPHENHIWQAMAYCLLVHQAHGKRPPHAVIQYADRQFAVDYTPQMEAQLVRLLEEMHDEFSASPEDGGPGRSHTDRVRCLSCGLRHACDEALG